MEARVMAVGTDNDQSIIASMVRAIKLSEEAVGQVARIAVEGIRCGLETNALSSRTCSKANRLTTPGQ
jgi:hypothetical protein